MAIHPMNSVRLPTPDAIADTYRLIAPHLRTTPILECRSADFGVSAPSLRLKLEHTQVSGSFKARGALANLMLRPVPESGVVAASGGNHGAAVAYAASTL